MTNGTPDHLQIYHDCQATPITSIFTTHLKKLIGRITLKGDETSTHSNRTIFDTILPRRTYTDSYGDLRLFEILKFDDAASFELAIEKRMFGKLPTTLSIY